MDDGSHRKLMANIYQIGKLRITAIARSRPAAISRRPAACADELKLDPEMVNVNGGALAIGHPLGCSGARVSTTLLHEMRRRGSARGAASMRVGVGQGIATLWEAC